MALKHFVALCFMLVPLLTTGGAIAQVPATATRLVDGCAPGSGYDPACDLNFDGAIDVLDMQLAAAHWSQSGAHTGRAPMAKTGAGPIAGYTPSAGEDILLQRGMAWPNPRFTDNNNGTVTDNLTGLIWLKDADCFGRRDWHTALLLSNILSNGVCGLSDGSTAGQWRMSNFRELQSLVHIGFIYPALSDTAGTSQWTEGDPFVHVRQDYPYWSSTTWVGYPATGAWYVRMGAGDTSWNDKVIGEWYLWPVRGGR
jgi:hypothetical protein